MIKHKRFECGVERKFECSICFKKFRHKHHVKDHIRLIHS